MPGPPPIDAVPNLVNTFRASTDSPCTDNANLLQASNIVSANSKTTFIHLHTVAENNSVEDLTFTYGNKWAGPFSPFGQFYSDFPNYAPIMVKGWVANALSDLTATPTTGWPMTWGGKDHIWVPGGQLVDSDRIPNPRKGGQQYFSRTCVYTAALLGVLPAPVTTPNAVGGNLAGGTYQVSVACVYPSGFFGAGSNCTATTVVTNGSITVTSPTNPNNGSIGYRVFMGLVGASNTDMQYSTDSGIVPYGTPYNITARFQTSTPGLIARPMVSGNRSPGYPTGTGVLGGTNTTGTNNGECEFTGFDYTELPTISGAGQNARGTSYGPANVRGRTSKGVVATVTVGGDSVPQAVGEAGYGGSRGGYANRAMHNQYGLRFNPAIVPKFNTVWIARSSETAAEFATPHLSQYRMRLCRETSHVMTNYGANDYVSNPIFAAQTLSNIVTVAKMFCDRGQYYFHHTINPRTNSNDAYMSVSGQTFKGNQIEGVRRALNNCIIATGAGRNITNENMFAVYTTAGGVNTNMYGGGNGVATTFLTQYPFVIGSEQVRVNGALLTPLTDYTYTDSVSLGGTLHASGVVIAAAPGNGLSVRASYTSCPSMAQLVNSTYFRTGIATSLALEVNAAGVPTFNGGFYRGPIGGTVSFAVSAVTSQTVTPSGFSMSINQYNGYSLTVLADPVTPAAVNQSLGIISNSNTVFTLSTTWTQTPSTSATIGLTRQISNDGSHPTSDGHILQAASIPLSLITL